MKHIEDEDLARLLDGRVSKKERKRLRQHISECSKCFDLYTESLKSIMIEERKESPSPVSGSNTAHIIWKKIRDFFTVKRYRLALAAFLIILMVFLPNVLKELSRRNHREKWAFEVFERMKNIADKVDERPPRLVILKADSKDIPNAFAAPDGSIIINSKLLEFCCSDTQKEKGDVRLAFILGHELAHLADRDFSHFKAFYSLKKHSNGKVQKQVDRYVIPSDAEELAEYKRKELLADQKGALYAAMAGYKIRFILEENSDFLNRWIEYMGIDYHTDTPSHPAMQKRVQFVRSRLSEVAKNIELFRAGVLLFQKGSYHDSLAAFRKFEEFYPAREVLNNIGACYLNLALRLLQQKFSTDYYRFRLYTAIDYSTSAETFTTRNDWDYLRDKYIPGYLEEAISYFKKAVEKDVLDRACRYNLSAALILKKQYARAQAECDYILEKDPKDIQALNNKAIALYYDKEMKSDTIQHAIQILRKAHRLKPQNAEILYNLASLRQESNQSNGAKLIWEKYLNLPLSKRDNFYHHIYQKFKGSPPPKPSMKAKFPKIPAGFALGQEIHDIDKKRGKEHTRVFTIGSDDSEDNPTLLVELKLILINNIRVLAIDGTIEIVEQEFEPVENIETILKKYSLPQKIVRFNIGSYYVYEHSGFSIKEIKGKVCAFTWFAGDL